jgi:hypothetical protein
MTGPGLFTELTEHGNNIFFNLTWKQYFFHETSDTFLQKTKQSNPTIIKEDITDWSWSVDPEFHPDLRCLVVVRLFIDTQNRLVTLHSTLIKTHEETDISPCSVIYRPVGSTRQLVTKLSPPIFFPYSRTIGTWSPRSSEYRTFSCQESTS